MTDFTDILAAFRLAHRTEGMRLVVKDHRDFSHRPEQWRYDHLVLIRVVRFSDNQLSVLLDYPGNKFCEWVSVADLAELFTVIDTYTEPPAPPPRSEIHEY